MNIIKIRNIVKGQEHDFSDYNEVEFNLENGDKIRAYIKEGILRISCNDTIKVIPQATNCVNIEVDKK